MKKEDLVRIVEETILEMLKEGDESLIGLMMEHEKKLGREVDQETFLTETIQALSDKLGLITEEEEVSEEEKQALSEQEQMLTLAKFLETGDHDVLKEARSGKLDGWSDTMFGSIEIGEEFKMPNDPDDAILIKVSKTSYKVKSKGHPASGLKFGGVKPKEKVYTKKG